MLVDETVRKQLASGALVIVRHDQGYAVILARLPTRSTRAMRRWSCSITASRAIKAAMARMTITTQAVVGNDDGLAVNAGVAQVSQARSGGFHKTHSLGQISHALYDVGGEYRRNM